MPAWILSALRLLGVGVGVEAGGRAIERVTGVDIPFLGGGGGGFLGRAVTRRRRRKRALTASDREDLLFLSSMVTKEKLAAIAALMVAN